MSLGVYWVLPSFTEFYYDSYQFVLHQKENCGTIEYFGCTEQSERDNWNLPSFTGFYRVLPSFTEFYRVLPSFGGISIKNMSGWGARRIPAWNSGTWRRDGGRRRLKLDVAASRRRTPFSRPGVVDAVGCLFLFGSSVARSPLRTFDYDEKDPIGRNRRRNRPPPRRRGECSIEIFILFLWSGQPSWSQPTAFLFDCTVSWWVNLVSTWCLQLELSDFPCRFRVKNSKWTRGPETNRFFEFFYRSLDGDAEKNASIQMLRTKFLPKMVDYAWLVPISDCFRWFSFLFGAGYWL